MIAPRGGLHRARIRPALLRDVPTMVDLVAPHARAGRMLPRSADEFRDRLGAFLVGVDRSGKVVACGGLRAFPDGSVEVVSLAVADVQRGTGLGGRLLDRLLARSRAGGAGRTFALTLSPGFFESRGFRTASRASFPGKVAADCMGCPRRADCREVAVVVEHSPERVAAGRHGVRVGALTSCKIDV